jgi:protein TonB
MFDLITGQARHLPRRQTGPMLISTIVQSLAWALVIALPLLYVTQSIPDVPTMMAFVAAAPAPPPPPPPPAAAPAKPADQAAKPVATAGATIPVSAPAKIAPEAATPTDVGVPGGVEGGVPGGVIGGIVGGLPTEVPPPPPPPPPAARVPVRTGGNIQAPALLHRVEPEYPPLAVRAQLQGLVILEATVDENGRVQSVKVLRSDAPLLDGAAIAAVKQWRYAPLTLNGTREPFILTVMLSFHLTPQQ